jgi:ADP-L-glycero-D-manno-heptose 6-epimerase
VFAAQPMIFFYLDARNNLFLKSTNKSMIIVTGAAGFIGSCLVKRLNHDNFNSIIAVDKFGDLAKDKNLAGTKIQEFVDRENFMSWLEKNFELVEFIFHIGAKTDTAESDTVLLNRMNTQYTKDVWARCIQYQIPLVYASSGATYGLGEFGYDDDESKIHLLKPLNPYGQSKQDFDAWALQQGKKPFFWAGLKFFNVYGPNEYHKGRMASVIWHAFSQINKTNKMKLFRSHNPKFKDGEQMRDFVYVKDVVDVCIFLMHHRKNSGIYNLGSGTARTFLDLTKSVFKAMGKKEEIEFIDTPLDIRDKYQYFTEANMKKLKTIGYSKPFHSLEEGTEDYVKNHLINNCPVY